MKKLLAGVAAGALLLVGGIALAQIAIPQVLNVGTSDLFQDIVGGRPGPGSSYATGYQISGPVGYHDAGVASTAWTYTFTSGQVFQVMRPSATLATGTLTTEPNPGDGQRECFFSTQTQTAITWTANTGQTMGSDAPTAGVANAAQCMIYEAASATWHRVQ